MGRKRQAAQKNAKTVAWTEEVFGAVERDDVATFVQHMGNRGTLPSHGLVSVLHVAASANAVGIVNWVCTEGVATNGIDLEREMAKVDDENGWTPLHRALYFGNIGVVAELLKSGAAVHVKDHEGCTPLDLAQLHLDEVRSERSFVGQYGPMVADPSVEFGASRANAGFAALADLGQDYDDDELVVGGFSGLEPDPDLVQASADSSDGEETIKTLRFDIFSEAANNLTGDQLRRRELDRVLDLPTLYSWGSSRNYALGHRDGDSKSRPTILPTFAPPVGDGTMAVEALARTTRHISTSSYHTLFLTGAGRVLSCGFGRGHRLGTGDESTRLEPAVIDSLKHVKCVDIAAGRNHSAVVSAEGHLYLWGSNEQGQLGMDVPVGPFPARMRSCKDFFFRGVAVSKCHTVAWGVHRRSTTACVWTFGANHGQLGFQRKGSRDTTPDWQPRQVPFFGSDRVVVAASTTKKVSVCLTADRVVYIMQDFGCRRLPPLPSPYPEGFPLVQGSPSTTVVKVMCCDAHVCALGRNGRLYVFFDGSYAPVLWNVDRVSFRLVDFCVGKAETSRILALIVVAEDGNVYRSSIHLTSGRIEATPNRVRCISQTHRVYCGPHAEHLFGVVYSRKLPSVSVSFKSPKQVALVEFASEERNAILAMKEAILVYGDTCALVESSVLHKSPYLGTCCLPRWHNGDQLSTITITLPHKSPEWFENHSKVLDMLAAYLQTGILCSAGTDVLTLLELASVAHAILMPHLQLICERQASANLGLDSQLIQRAFVVALNIDSGPLLYRCAEITTANLENLIETRQLQSFPPRAFEFVTAFYHATFIRKPTFAVTLSLPLRHASAFRSNHRHALDIPSSGLQCAQRAKKSDQNSARSDSDDDPLHLHELSSSPSSVSSKNSTRDRGRVDLGYMDNLASDSLPGERSRTSVQSQRRPTNVVVGFDVSSSPKTTPMKSRQSRGRSKQSSSNDDGAPCSGANLNAPSSYSSGGWTKEESTFRNPHPDKRSKTRAKPISLKEIFADEEARGVQTASIETARGTPWGSPPTQACTPTSFRSLLASEEKSERVAARSLSGSAHSVRTRTWGTPSGSASNAPIPSFSSLMTADEMSQSSSEQHGLSIPQTSGSPWCDRTISAPIGISASPHWRRHNDELPGSPFTVNTVLSVSPSWTRHSELEHAQRTTSKTSFLEILNGQQFEKAVDSRVRSKSMKAIQLEERALKEFATHYKFIHGDEEWIEVSLLCKMDGHHDKSRK